MSLTNYGCHIEDITSTGNLRYGHIDEIFVHIYGKTQPTAAAPPHVIAKYASKAKMPTNLGLHPIYAKYLTSIHGRSMCISVPYMKSRASSM